MIDNTGAAIALRENQSNQKLVEQYSKTDDYKNMARAEQQRFFKRYGPREVPQVILGSTKVSLESLINIQVRNAKGEVVKLNIRPLAANESSAKPIELEPHNANWYQFVVESDQLQGLADGLYYLAAGVDTRNQNDMWQGWAFSKTMIVKLVSKADVANWLESEQRAQLIGTYLLQDKQFEKAEQHARAWIKRHPDSVDAWALLGESLLGRDVYQEALDSFLTAIDKFRAKFGNNPAELPMALIDPIAEIERESGLRPPLNPDDPVPDENTPRPDGL